MFAYPARYRLGSMQKCSMKGYKNRFMGGTKKLKNRIGIKQGDSNSHECVCIDQLYSYFDKW